jgi:hypothetical protein
VLIDFVFEMKVVGLGGLFYPFKHYYVYRSDSPHLFIGTWGGPPNQVGYYIFPDHLPQKNLLSVDEV